MGRRALGEGGWVHCAVTGKAIDEGQLKRTGEVISNLDRAILAREGHRGRESDIIPDVFHTKPYKNRTRPEDPALAPGKDGEMISRKGAALDRRAFEKAKDDYYEMRGWDIQTGLQTKTKLEELGLHDVVENLKRRRLVV